MNIFDALDQVESPVDEPAPITVDIRDNRLDDGMAWMLWNVALAKLSGMLDEAETLEDLQEATTYGQQIYDLGMLTEEQLQGEASKLVTARIADWERAGCPYEQ